ncbi:glycoside hydrolase 43 family protein [Ferruginibacter sp. HRS2-29]|uniref:glycoside hydrolase family 43 protein n=1 Tax=Ferruginibacter sp. HRS2-29 TaxID=2487334 RepID=UPI0020CD5C60|nr:glycoside hydrolase 43 family protein [Ferruginibacter sp. HRS2-29]MCP9752007.1 glycoside hydrolase [Ferruginibacter sp. HRS2-29]
MNRIIILFFLLSLSQSAVAQNSNELSKVWVADNGDGTYKNPVIHADYSDPDVIRVGEDYYMVASSFNAVPGLPILHSKDMVNWQLIGHALQRQVPEKDFDKVQHGGGVWAPAIRYHKNEFYIFYPDPDQGIFLTKAKNINGPWCKPLLVEAGQGLIDPCPLWDYNGKVYLVHAYAGSRAGFKSILVIKEMNATADKVIGNAVMVFDGHKTDPTLEGPKIYKHNGYYYIFAPAGGVSTGWQLALKSKNIYGPYERRVVMSQGSTFINGPHQGAWVTTSKGEDWFFHFQDKDAYGRIVHLQPMAWKNDWPVIGIDKDGDGIGEPVATHKKPFTGKVFPVNTIVESDEFNKPSPGLQWQWQADPQPGWAFPTSEGHLTMFCICPRDSLNNYWMLPNLLSQKLPAENFNAITRLSFYPKNNNDRTGLILFGTDYAFVSLVKKDSGVFITYNTCIGAEKNKPENELFVKKITGKDAWLKVAVTTNAVATFSFSEDGKTFITIPGEFRAAPGKWVGAKVGLFSTSTVKTNDAGYSEIDWFRIGKN